MHASSVISTGWQIDGLDVCLESLGFGSHALWQMMSLDPLRYQDIQGGDIGRIMSDLDWRYSGLATPSMVCFSLRDGVESEDPAVAGAWVGLIARRDGALGLNLSYAIHPDFSGKGLAKLLSSAALASFIELHREAGTELTFANCEFRAANVPSAVLAKSIFGSDGVYAQRDIALPTGPIAMGQFRLPVQSLYERATCIVDQAGDRFALKPQLQDGMREMSYARNV